MSVGICTAAIGEQYHYFLPEWAEAIDQLSTEEDWVTIAHDGVDDKIRRYVDQLLHPLWVRVENTASNPAVNVNAAIACTGTDWIMKLDVDDLLLPHALDGVTGTDADVLCFGFRMRGTDHPGLSWATESILMKTGNLVASCSPFRRWVWEHQPFQDVIYDDWLFWINAARNGARFAGTNRIDYQYRVHDLQMTKHVDHARAYAQIKEC